MTGPAVLFWLVVIGVVAFVVCELLDATPDPQPEPSRLDRGCPEDDQS